MRGQPPALSPAETELARRSPRRGLIVSGIVLAAISALIGGLLYLEAEPPKVTLDSSRFRVESFVYSQEFKLDEITEVSLQEHIPRIRGMCSCSETSVISSSLNS